MECKESYAPYKSPNLSSLTAEQQQYYFRGKRAQLRRDRNGSAKKGAAIRQLDVAEVSDHSDSDIDVDDVDWRDFQMGGR